jgi:hypothetical protein
MKATIINAAKTLLTVAIGAWVVAQIFPGLIGSVLSGQSPDFTRK